MRRSIFAIFLFLNSIIAYSEVADSAQPNIIVIMADDLGYGDLSCYGATSFKTPNIDRLAAEGKRFTNGYCSASTCTPTRYSLLTGAYAFRRKGTGIAAPNSRLIIPEETFTLADVMKKANYQTAVVGKWHLGLGGEAGPDWNGELSPGPRQLGFDYNFLLPTTNDRVPQVFVENDRVLNLDPSDPLWVGNELPTDDHPTGNSHRATLKMDWSQGHNGTIHNGISRIGFYTGGMAARFRDEDLGDQWVDRSVKWIEANRDRPFFLFFASHDLHVPRMPHERFQGVTPNGFRSDSIVQFDWCVGELMRTLKRLELDEKTLVVLCSDNGPVLNDGYKDFAVEKLGTHQPSGGLRGGKYSIDEGGTRTPFITYWKGTIPPGESDEVVCTIDLAASFASLCGVELPADACLDSFNVMDALMGKPNAKGRDHLVQQDNGQAGNYGFRAGSWKLQRRNARKPTFQLFDLAKDASETKDVIGEFPEVADRLKKQLQEIIEADRSRK
jgi:arylsulfatase A-like enzyme